MKGRTLRTVDLWKLRRLQNINNYMKEMTVGEMHTANC